MIFILWMTCWAFSSFCQSTLFNIHRVDLPESVHDQNVTLVEKDKAGLLWYATHGSLYRYDGSQVIRLDLHSTPSIIHPSITALLADKRDHLWIGSKNGLTCLDLLTWTTKNIPAQDIPRLSAQDLYIRAIGQDKEGNTYAGTENGKLYVVKNDSLRLILDIGRDFPHTYKLLSITGIYEPYPGQLWLRTAFDKLVRILVDKGNYGPPAYFGPKEFGKESTYSACFDTSGKCLIMVENQGLYLLNTHTGAITRPPDQPWSDLGKSGMTFMASCGKSKVLLLTNQTSVGKNKLFIYNFLNDSISEHTIRFPEYLKDNRLDWLRMASDSSLFMALNNRILEIKPAHSLFKTFMIDADAINSIRCIYKARGGTLYVGSYKDGFVSLNEKTGEKERISDYVVYKILPWHADTLLLATEGEGLFWYEPARDKLTPIHISPASALNQPLGRFITALTRKDSGRVWAGTYQGLFLVDLYAKTCRLRGNNRLKQAKIYQVLKIGHHWLIANQYGITEWDPKTQTSKDFLKAKKPVIERHAVYCLAQVNKQIWMGTDGYGIMIADEKGNILDTINLSNGLADEIVYSLIPSGHQIIAGTQNGLSIINARGHQIQNYSTLNHLPSNEFNQSATAKSGDTIYMGTLNGIVRFDINKINQSIRQTPQIPIRISSITTEQPKKGIQHNYSIPYQKDTPLVIKSGSRYFSIHLGKLYELADQLQYYYRLGNDERWHAIGSGHEITFVGMHPGIYQLQLAAAMGDSPEIKNFFHVPLIVQPAFYQTVWFKIIIALILAFGIWRIIKYREKELQREKQLRIKIAGDLHDEVGASLTRIYFQADTLSNKTLNLSLDDKTHLQHIAATSKEALGSMSDMVWSIDSRFDTAGNLVARMKDYLFELKNDLDICYHFKVQGEYERLSLSQIVRQNFFLIFKEALNNAIKYGDGSPISVFLNFGSSIQLELKNRYLPGNHKSSNNLGGRGLQSMKQRAAGMKGSLHIREDGMEYAIQLTVSREGSHSTGSSK